MNIDDLTLGQIKALASSFSPQVGLACFFFAATATAVFASWKGTEYADDRSWARPFWWVPFLGFLALAYWLAYHAISVLF